MTVAATGAALGLIVVVGTVVTGFAAHQWVLFFAYQRLQNLDWYHSASPAEQRATAHHALAFLPGDPHDAFAVLQMHGDRSSIPFLRAALAQAPEGQGQGLSARRTDATSAA